MAYVSKMDINGKSYPVGSMLYGTCETESTAVNKVVSDMTFFDKLEKGVQIYVKFTFSNAAVNPELNVNNTGSHRIYKYGSTAPLDDAGGSWQSGEVVPFVYDGANWMMCSQSGDSFNGLSAEEVATVFTD